MRIHQTIEDSIGIIVPIPSKALGEINEQLKFPRVIQIQASNFGTATTTNQEIMENIYYSSVKRH